MRNVWQMTSSFQDDHTRSLILRGGSLYSPYRGAECRWIENDDGTERDIPPSCAAAAATTPVNGSTPHLMGGSHWYFPPAFELNTYGKYFLMGPSYDRAGTIGFRCVADAVDNCGTNGTLCPIIDYLPRSYTLPDSKNSDWLHFTNKSASPVARADIGPAQIAINQISAAFPVNTRNGTKFSWKNGDDKAPSGIGETGGGLFVGNDNGVTLSAPAPEAKSSSRLSLYLSSTDGFPGIIKVNVGAHTYSSTFEGPVLYSFDYKSYPLSVTVMNKPGASCTPAANNTRICLHAPTAVDGITSLSDSHLGADAEVLDWVHWGETSGSNETGPWYADKMKLGMGILQATLVMPNNQPSDLQTYVDAAATYSWSHGFPTQSGVFQSGVFSEKGSFYLSIPADPSNKIRHLRLYAGVFSTAAKFVALSEGVSKAQYFDKKQGTRNYVISFTFTGAVTIEWSRDTDADPTEEGNLTLQAAQIESVNGDYDEGIILQTAVLTTRN